MQKQDFKIFPTLVTKYSNFLTKDQLDDIFNYCKGLPTIQHDAWEGDATSSHRLSQNIIDMIEENVVSCQGLKNDINFFIELFAKEHGYTKDMYIFNSWFNIQQKGSLLKMHVHPNSIFSAALFINAEPGSSKLFFKNPNAFLEYLNVALEGHTNQHVVGQGDFAFEPKAGDLILFPSWLKHGSNETTNQSSDRMSISFNTKFTSQ